MTEDPFKIDFQRDIGVREARTLCRHLVLNLSDSCYLDLYTKQHECFGERFRSKGYVSPNEVPVTTGERNLSGAITRTSNMSSVEFSFLRCFDKRDRERYASLRLGVGAYDWDELQEENRALVQDIRNVVNQYFQR
jgi:hypothetical protein